MQLALDVKPTSAIALQHLREMGLLGDMQLHALELLLDHGPLTGQELDRVATGGRGHLHKRLPELARLGLARSLPSRVCTVTGHRAIVWEAVIGEPITPAPRLSRREQLVEALCAAFRDAAGLLTGPEIAERIRLLAGGRQ